MGRTQFQKAARHFVEGAIDPRLLLTYFEELRPALYEKTPSAFLSEDKHRVNAQDDYMEVEIYTGIDQHRPSETSVDDISECSFLTTIFLIPHSVPLSVHQISAHYIASNDFFPGWRTKKRISSALMLFRPIIQY